MPEKSKKKETKPLPPYKLHGYIHYCQECKVVIMEKIDETKPNVIKKYVCPCRGFEMLKIVIDSFLIHELLKKD